MAKKLDSETAKVLSDTDKVARFVDSDDWKEVKNKLMNRIMDLQSIMNISAATAEEVVADIKARRLAVEILWDFLRDVEGTAQNMKYTNPAILEQTNQDVIINFQ